MVLVETYTCLHTHAYAYTYIHTHTYTITYDDTRTLVLAHSLDHRRISVRTGDVEGQHLSLVVQACGRVGVIGWTRDENRALKTVEIIDMQIDRYG